MRARAGSFIVTLIATMFLSSAMGGCVCEAGQAGIGRVEYLQNLEQTANAIHVKAWGFLIVTNSADAGVTLGAADKLYIFPGPASGGNFKTVILDAAIPDSRAQMKSTTRPSPSDWQNPIAFMSTTTGLVIAANRNMIGLRIGTQVTDAIDLPAQSQTLLVLKYSSIHPAQASVRVKEYGQ